MGRSRSDQGHPGRHHRAVLRLQSSYDDNTQTFNNLSYSREGWDRKAIGANFLFANTWRRDSKFYRTSASAAPSSSGPMRS
jgi:hypothetical protein